MVETNLDLYVFRIWLKSNKSVMQHIIKDIASNGLTLENFMVMELLYHKGPQNIQAISEKLQIASGSITNVVNRLEKKSYVVRNIDPNNRRYCKVQLTDEGTKMFDKIFPVHTDVITENFAVLEEEEKQQLASLLKKIGLDAQGRL